MILEKNRMNLKNKIKQLEKKKIISRQPHPLIPFILTAIIYVLAVQTSNINLIFSKIFYGLATFTLIFAIIHFMVYKILTRK